MRTLSYKISYINKLKSVIKKSLLKDEWKPNEKKFKHELIQLGLFILMD